MQDRSARGWISRVTSLRVPIRAKLALALVVPTLTLVVVAGVQYLKIADQTGATERQTQLATAADGPSALIVALQNERNFTVVEIIGQEGIVILPVDDYEEAYSHTEAALEQFHELLEDSDDRTIQAYGPAVDALEGLQELRARIADWPGPRVLNPEATEFANQAYSDYTELISPFFDGTTEIAKAVDDITLRQGAELVDLSSRLAEEVGEVVRRTIAYAVISEGGVNTDEEIQDLAGLLGTYRRLADAIRLRTTGAYADMPDDQHDEFEMEVSDHVGRAMQTGELDLGAFLDVVTVPNEESYNGFRDSVAGRLRELADEINRDAADRQRIYLLAVVLTVVVATAAVWIASLSITRPLQSLRNQAIRMARRDLPDAVSGVLETPLGEDVPSPSLPPISVRTRDEVADVANSLNQVQESALNLAVGEAVLRKNVADSLVNMGRRNQSLLARQLDFITQLERNEADPDALANLFRLDHLATRMRRNAESLLVLAGVQTPRRWTTPVRIKDIVRAALSEVEDYRRAKVGYVEAVSIPGSVAADLAHLMAELVENALIFSPPDESVEIHGLSQVSGYTIVIVDRGLGMRPYEIAQANRRLGGGESFTISPSKYLGHYVAGNLAVRHSIHVQLRETERHGVTATIHVPARLAAPDAGTPTPRYAGYLLGERARHDTRDQNEAEPPPINEKASDRPALTTRRP